MARRRDYKAEYAAAKRRAANAGYNSEREYKRARKALGIPRNASPIPKRLAPFVSTGYRRMESKAWSKKHSIRYTSAYRDSMTDDQVDRYWRAYVEPIHERGKSGQREKRRRIRDYLVPDILDDKEWTGKYPI